MGPYATPVDPKYLDVSSTAPSPAGNTIEEPSQPRPERCGDACWKRENPDNALGRKVEPGRGLPYRWSYRGKVWDSLWDEQANLAIYLVKYRDSFRWDSLQVHRSLLRERTPPLTTSSFNRKDGLLNRQ